MNMMDKKVCNKGNLWYNKNWKKFVGGKNKWQKAK